MAVKNKLKAPKSAPKTAKHIVLFSTLFAGLFATAAMAGDAIYPGFEKVPASYKTKRGTLVTTPYIPPFRDQHYTKLCSAFVAASFTDAINCLLEGNTNCSKLPLNKMASVLDLARRSKYDDEIDAIRNRADFPKDPVDADFYRGLDLDGVSSEVIFSESETVFSEAMIPFEPMFSGRDGKRTIEQGLKAFEELKTIYNTTRAVSQTSGAAKAQAYVEKQFPKIDTLFGYPHDDAEVKAAFLEENLQFFYEKLFIPTFAKPKTVREYDILRTKYQVKVPFIIGQLGHYPSRIIHKTGEDPMKMAEDLMRTGNYADAIKHINEALAGGSPLIVHGFCASTKMPKNRNDCFEADDKTRSSKKHTFLITGYKEVCNADGNCFDAIRVLNSWGAWWQHEFDHEGLDGWVKALPTFERTFYNARMLRWYSN